MKNREWSIGRKESNLCDVLLEDETISSKHAFLRYEQGKFYIIDTKSLNGTFLLRSSYKIEVTKAEEIFPNDHVIFGNKIVPFSELLDLTINKEVEDELPQPKKEGKKIRCMECFKPILSNEICPSCNSNIHLKEVT